MAWGLAPTGDPVLESVTWEIVWAEEQAPMIGQHLASLLNWQVFWVLGRHSSILGALSDIQGPGMEYQRHLDKL